MEMLISDHTTSRKKEKPFKCEICLINFRENFLLNRHQRFVHANERPFKCKICLNSFRCKSNLKIHQITVHENEKPFNCNICKKSFGERFFLGTF